MGSEMWDETTGVVEHFYIGLQISDCGKQERFKAPQRRKERKENL